MKMFGFLSLAGVVLLVMWVWMAPGLWPQRWVEWRAEHGDQGAVHLLFERAVRAGHAEDSAYWSAKRRKIAENEALFLDVQSRDVVKLQFEFQGKPTPLLDLIEY